MHHRFTLLAIAFFLSLNSLLGLVSCVEFDLENTFPPLETCAVGLHLESQNSRIKKNKYYKVLKLTSREYRPTAHSGLANWRIAWALWNVNARWARFFDTWAVSRNVRITQQRVARRCFCLLSVRISPHNSAWALQFKQLVQIVTFSEVYRN